MSRTGAEDSNLSSSSLFVSMFMLLLGSISSVYKGPLPVVKRASIHRFQCFCCVIKKTTAPTNFQPGKQMQEKNSLIDLYLILSSTHLEWDTLIDKEDFVNKRNSSNTKYHVIKIGNRKICLV